MEQTVREYNDYCENGHDDQYGKNPKFLRPVREGKFYGLRLYSASYQTIGGVKVNGRTEVLTKDWEVIPGLYAAGDIIAAELFGNPPLIGYGNLGFALSSGRVAGRSAHEYLQG